MSEATNTREAILNRIRAANATAQTTEYQAIERNYQQTATLKRESILKIFAERLHEYDANIFEAKQNTLAATIAEILKSHNQKSVIVADHFAYNQNLPSGFSFQRESESTTEQMDTAGYAISGCEVAIAHTGTIILRSARKLTLLPDRLLCIVHEDQIVETVPEAIARLEQFKTEPLTFVSGPSATADIEMTRIRGVHGPRFLDVIVVRN
jgi:L-lactate dehydrogenase complex protein LldG